MKKRKLLLLQEWHVQIMLEESKKHFKKKNEKVKFAAVNLATNICFVIGEDVDIDEIKRIVESVGYGISDEFPEMIEEKRYRRSKKKIIMQGTPCFCIFCNSKCDIILKRGKIYF